VVLRRGRAHPADVITPLLIHWINRPTFQQVVEVGGITAARAAGNRAATAPRATT
jgi:hypothetical protein